MKIDKVKKIVNVAYMACMVIIILSLGFCCYTFKDLPEKMDMMIYKLDAIIYKTDILMDNSEP